MQCLALILSPDSIRVNTVHPTDVAMTTDVTDAILWLVSDAARCVSGATVTVHPELAFA
jgi:NAD(P)-dependent dehydrogenase (short-subunit alcohol dehydrogenase family)